MSFSIKYFLKSISNSRTSLSFSGWISTVEKFFMWVYTPVNFTRGDGGKSFELKREVERGSTFMFTRDISYIEILRDSGNPS